MNKNPILPFFLAAAATLTGCGARSNLPGDSNGYAALPGKCTAVSAPALAGRVRDFSMAHPDFETAFIGDDRGIVEALLGPDGKPVYAGQKGHPSTSGQADFDQWYRDVPGTNLGADLALPLTSSPEGFAFGTDDFFPIDGRLLGDEGMVHNYSFTFEGHTSFRYQGGETFVLSGDDNLWAFIDGHLVLDLGGVHSTEDGQVAVDGLALKRGGVYPVDVFFAERHTTGSTFHLSLLGFELCE